ncbi:MAG TPA: 50S ribosomal protein L19 [Candidatus Faecisoma merdavium]|nr:50S ribosomal protein L19 [Candidatus Faecisoma merdavium]
MIIVYVKESDIVNLIDKITAKQIRNDMPEFRVGYTVKVNVKIVEGKRERIQAFEGIVMAIQGSGVSRTFTVRKLSNGIGVERTFPINSPVIDSIEVVRTGRVRQAKLGYIRTMAKKPKIKERRAKETK